MLVTSFAEHLLERIFYTSQMNMLSISVMQRNVSFLYTFHIERKARMCCGRKCGQCMGEREVTISSVSMLCLV
uniref:Uncharacterized protein n=1 Tax=Anguilla anguilla TaxID=7936 RepID=A0A0E9X6F4_ANGAN